jgi:ribonuclease HII
MGRGRRSTSWMLFKHDRPFVERHGFVAGVDEAGRGPLAGPVVAAAVILPPDVRLPHLNDSKQLLPEARWSLYQRIQRTALAIGVGIVGHDEIDRINIFQASLAAMRWALAGLIIQPCHVLVDGFAIPSGPASQTGIIDGDAKSASIAAASVVAKVTRDCLMENLDRAYPGYGFKQHKGYATPAHLACLQALGPCPIHRRSFLPVRSFAPLALAAN